MKIFSHIQRAITLESFNIAAHDMFRSQLKDGSILDVASWIITAAISVYCGWKVSEKNSYSQLVIFKTSILLWALHMIIPISIWTLEFFMGVILASQLEKIVTGYLIVSPPIFIFLYGTVFTGSWFSQLKAR